MISEVAQKQCKSFLIWDSDSDIPVWRDGPVVLWRSCNANVNGSWVSVPNLVEEHASELRARYLAWVYELGERRVGGRRLVDHLELRPDFSYWWMTLLAEKCNYAKSPQIDDAIRVLAFANWVKGKKINRLNFVSANLPLAECLRGWCEKVGVEFNWRRLPAPESSLFGARRAFAALPRGVQAWLWLFKYLFERLPLCGIGLKNWRQSAADVTFVSYLFNLEPTAVEQGQFESRYWAHLPNELTSEGYKTNWLHLYVKDALAPNAKIATGIIRDFNKTAHGDQTHATLDTFLSFSVVGKTIKDWAKLAWLSWRLRLAKMPPISGDFDLWPLLSEDWKKSMQGQTAMANLLQSNLLEAAMRALPRQKVGVYLQENQGWEFSLIAAWKRVGHGRLIGCPHSVVRFWDLRYFFDPRSYVNFGSNTQPRPDQVAINGQISANAYLAGNYPKEDLVQVEALRYMHLRMPISRFSKHPERSQRGINLLVLGDYLATNTRLQMGLLEQAAESLPTGTVITVKPHPACLIDPEDYPELCLKVVTEPLSVLLADCDVAYTSAFTSAAVDAFCAGIPVVSVFDPRGLNLSPLRGCTGIRFASTPAELVKTIVLLASEKNNAIGGQKFFNTDPSLERWRSLLFR